MSSQSSQRASSSSSSGRSYDVFLSFRGADTRKKFTDHLYRALEQRSILVFRDDEGLERGEYINDGLLKAIQGSEYAVVVISENYAISKACLMELAEIMDRRREKKLKVLPVFYHVDPSVKKNQKFGEAFAKHRENLERNTDRWIAALKEVGDIAGWPVKDESHESTVIDEICGSILNGVRRNLPSVFSKRVGMEFRVEEMLTLLSLWSDDVRWVGICGMGGIGKTTLIEHVYFRISSEFEVRCLIQEVSKNSGDLLSLQRQLISEIYKSKDIKGSGPPKVSNTLDGVGLIEKGVRNKKVLIVLDDVDKEAHLEKLLERSIKFGLGSRILLTSRDTHLLKRYMYQNDQIYEVKELDDDDALELFCRKAFKQRHPKENFVELSKEIVSYAGRLPLAVETSGSSLWDRSMEDWKSARNILKAKPSPDILNVLKVSYDRLAKWEQELFLDIACFFSGEDEDDVILKLESPDCSSRFGIGTLKDKSLIKIFNGKIQMHDLLVTLGRQIVDDEFPKEPWRRSRLWSQRDIISVLKRNIENHAVQSIVLRLPFTTTRELHFEFLSKMKGLKMLVIRPEAASQVEASDDEIWEALQTLEWRGDPSELKLSDELRIIDWWGCPLESLPTGFQPGTHPSRYVRLDIHAGEEEENLPTSPSANRGSKRERERERGI